MSDANDPILDHTAGILSAYVSRHAVAVSDLPSLMRTVRDGLLALREAPVAAALPEPAVDRPSTAQIRKSVRPTGSSASSTARPTRRSSAT
jgi:predicted transcriptional regulator